MKSWSPRTHPLPHRRQPRPRSRDPRPRTGRLGRSPRGCRNPQVRACPSPTTPRNGHGGKKPTREERVKTRFSAERVKTECDLSERRPRGLYGRVTAGGRGGSPRRGRAAPLALPPYLPHVGNRCFCALPARRHRICAGSCGRAADRRSRAGRSGGTAGNRAQTSPAGTEGRRVPALPGRRRCCLRRAARGAGPTAGAEKPGWAREWHWAVVCLERNVARAPPCPARGQTPHKQPTASTQNCPQATQQPALLQRLLRVASACRAEASGMSPTEYPQRGVSSRAGILSEGLSLQRVSPHSGYPLSGFVPLAGLLLQQVSAVCLSS